uniref:Uncharacterized protein n=1 Tax=Anopheles atroparvus TaxID=41427 RepID=A0AAG5DQK6_ANOAO
MSKRIFKACSWRKFAVMIVSQKLVVSKSAASFLVSTRQEASDRSVSCSVSCTPDRTTGTHLRLR